MTSLQQMINLPYGMRWPLLTLKHFILPYSSKVEVFEDGITFCHSLSSSP